MHITNDLKSFYEKFNILVNLLIRRSQRHKYRTKLYLRKLGPASEISPALKNYAHLEQHRKAPSLGNLWLYKEKRSALAGAGSVHTTVNSLYSGHCRYLELVSTSARVCYSESFFRQISGNSLIFAWDSTAVRVSVFAGCLQGKS